MSDMQLVRYDQMCQAIDAAYSVDEVAELRDKAMAMEHYMRQRNNVEAERRVCEIRLRAERKLGQLLAGMERAQGKRTDIPTSIHVEPKLPLSNALKTAGISQTQAQRWQKLAAIPEAEFNATFAQPQKPSTAGMIAAHAEPKQSPVDPMALWLWGRLLDFERQALLAGGHQR